MRVAASSVMLTLLFRLERSSHVETLIAFMAATNSLRTSVQHLRRRMNCMMLFKVLAYGMFSVLPSLRT